MTQTPDQKPPRAGAARGPSPQDDEPLLVVRDLSVVFPSRRTVARNGAGGGSGSGSDHGAVWAVDRLSLEIRRGETLALVGESGSGKSMTALSLLRLVPEPGRIASGEVRLAGEDLLRLPEAAMRRVRGDRIAMVFQEPMTSLNPVLSIGRQVAEAIRVHRRVSWRAALARAGELLEQVAIPDARDRLDAYPHEFSGGMRQRVMIAMALACEPELILADEPTTALDVTVQAQILELLKRLTRERGTALMLITHDLGVVARYADRVAVMYAGKLMEQGDARAVYARPRHPYTLGLMASVPRLDDPPGRRLVPIPGQPPDLSELPPGCRFAPRCAFVHGRCREERPTLLQAPGAASGHLRSCFGFEEPSGPQGAGAPARAGTPAGEGTER
ncbi:MAG: ABC transporter ATP-binding protein [Acidobacteria bacterium]|nr:MAG: ABC transporter ATP-binding protein [Acidobacteriota bacterium]REK03768.1 MAG: ABC transporter ATP-binding protein [Acidobacteriota bacterium]